MPTSERVRSAIVELSEVLSQLGYHTRDVIGPVDAAGEEIAVEEVEEYEEEVQYYLVGDTESASFYIVFGLDRNYAIIVYPMDVTTHLGRYLDEEEAEIILDEDINWDEINAQVGDQLRAEAAVRVVENSDPAKYQRPAFNLSMHASTALVNYRHTTTDQGFPLEFQCVRGIFPYTEKMSMARVDNRVYPVVVAGERGRRYVEGSFRVDKSDKKPEEFEFKSLF